MASNVEDLKIGESFQEGTKYLAGIGPVAAPEGEREISLPEPDLTLGGETLWKLLERRRSRRGFVAAPLTRQELSLLAWACQGVTHARQSFAFRAAPSAGALYPNDMHVVANEIQGLARGAYLYLPERHGLRLVREGDLREEVVRAGLGQRMLGQGVAAFIWTAAMERSLWKYRQRAYRYIYLDAGHICQNLYLACEALGLGCCGVAAFYDDAVNALTGADGTHETAVYMAAVGRIPNEDDRS